MKSELRINVRADESLKEDLREVIEKTGLSEAVIVREGVKEKLRSLKQTHPAYTVLPLAEQSEAAEVGA